MSLPSTSTRVLGVLGLAALLLFWSAPAWWSGQLLGEVGAEWVWRAEAGLLWREGPWVGVAQLLGVALEPGRAQGLALLAGLLSGWLILAAVLRELGSPQPLWLASLAALLGPALGAGGAGRLDLLLLPGAAVLIWGVLVARSWPRSILGIGLGFLLLTGGGLPAVAGLVLGVGFMAWWRDQRLWPLALLSGVALWARPGPETPWSVRVDAWAGPADLVVGQGSIGLEPLGVLLVLLVAWRARAAALALVLPLAIGLGPAMRCGPETPSIAGRTVPGPGVLLAQLPGAGMSEGWSEVAVVIPVLCVALLASVPLRRGGLVLLACVGLVGALLMPGGGRVAPAPPVPLAVRALAQGQGGVLDLPVRPPLDGHGQRVWHARHLRHRLVHGRPAPAAEPPGPQSPWAGEPLVALALSEQWATHVSDIAPGAVARGQGITTVVLHRDGVDAASLAVLDPLLRGLCGPPVRDLANSIDVYRLPAEGPAAPVDRTWPWRDLLEGKGQVLERTGYLGRWVPGGVPRSH